jgi:hypothetical protein
MKWCGGALLLALLTLQAQEVPRIERWELHTSLRSIRAIAPDSQGFWAATSGGLFAYERRSGELRPLRRTEGLLVQDLTAIAVDGRSGVVVAGSFDGILEVSLPDGSWKHVVDIAIEPGLPQRRINSIAIEQGRAYVGDGFRHRGAGPGNADHSGEPAPYRYAATEYAGGVAPAVAG